MNCQVKGRSSPEHRQWVGRAKGSKNPVFRGFWALPTSFRVPRSVPYGLHLVLSAGNRPECLVQLPMVFLPVNVLFCMVSTSTEFLNYAKRSLMPCAMCCKTACMACKRSPSTLPRSHSGPLKATRKPRGRSPTGLEQTPTRSARGPPTGTHTPDSRPQLRPGAHTPRESPLDLP